MLTLGALTVSLNRQSYGVFVVWEWRGRVIWIAEAGLA
jgi:hypothetical protein